MRYRHSLVNIHTHSMYSRHGEGEIKDYVKVAEERKILKVLGFSEHIPLPDRTLDYGRRMEYSDLPLYERDVREAKEKSDIKILLGGECDWIKDEASFYRDLLSERGYSYLLGSVHSMVDPDTGEDTYIGRIGSSFKKILVEYVDLYTQMLSSKIFLYGCHPDLFMSAYKVWDENAISASKDIACAAKELGIPLEMNDFGLRKSLIDTPMGKRHPYTNREFWLFLKEEGVKIVTGNDAHSPEEMVDADSQGYPTRSYLLAHECGIELAEWELDGDIIKVAD